MSEVDFGVFRRIDGHNAQSQHTSLARSAVALHIKRMLSQPLQRDDVQNIPDEYPRPSLCAHALLLNAHTEACSHVCKVSNTSGPGTGIAHGPDVCKPTLYDPENQQGLETLAGSWCIPHLSTGAREGGAGANRLYLQGMCHMRGVQLNLPRLIPRVGGCHSGDSKVDEACMEFGRLGKRESAVGLRSNSCSCSIMSMIRTDLLSQH